MSRYLRIERAVASGLKGLCSDELNLKALYSDGADAYFLRQKLVMSTCAWLLLSASADQYSEKD